MLNIWRDGMLQALKDLREKSKKEKCWKILHSGKKRSGKSKRKQIELGKKSWIAWKPGSRAKRRNCGDSSWRTRTYTRVWSCKDWVPPPATADQKMARMALDSAFEDDEEYFSHKPSIPIQSTRQECDRLQERLSEEEQRAIQLNQKLIEFNRLQITLSKQTKAMIELEKSYLQLQCHLRKGTSKPVVARICSRTSPFNSKNLCPKPSPPATPQPNGVS
ncbi:hypothetical protein AVEN_67962-1 [Araneus ventricosus]|uniref:Uncharacterized protein n=1 Tax=Araneus ventricosus TaxID=182803 RepID=A0A4Y2MJX6_ARAVE|nr:hypothetical protein AVEN_67962-1 [Araneus ventricosus]